MDKKFSLCLVLILTILLISIVFYVIPIFNTSNSDSLSSLSLSSQVKYFSKEIGPRLAGSVNESRAASYLATQFKKHGLETEIQEFKYYSLNSEEIKNSQNVVGTIKGVSPRQIIICADLDTVRDSAAGQYTEGANDDSSALALMVGLAEKYQGSKPHYTIKLIAFGASEEPFTFPLITPPRTSLDPEAYYKIVYTPYLVGARTYVLDHQEETENTLAVISLEAPGVGEPCFVNEDAFVKNNDLMVNFLVNNARLQGINAHEIDFAAFDKSGREGAISHIYLPFSYAGIPSTFLTCMQSPDLNSAIHNQSEIPDYLTVQDNYENLVKNNGNEQNLENHLQMVLYVVKDSVDKLSAFYIMNELI